MKDSFDQSIQKPYGPKATVQAFDVTKPAQNRIDYIFTQEFSILNYRTISDTRENLLDPSDHFPVLVQLKFE